MVDRQRADGTEVTLPDDVVERIETRLGETRFDSVEDYAAVALDLMLQEVAGQAEGGADDAEPTTAGADSTVVEESEATDPATDPETSGSATDSETSGSATDPETVRNCDTVQNRDAVEEQLESLGYL